MRILSFGVALVLVVGIYAAQAIDENTFWKGDDNMGTNKNKISRSILLK